MDGRPRDPRAVVAATLAATAECGLIFLPMRSIVQEVTGAIAGPLATYGLFAALFIGSVTVGTALRVPRPFPVAAGVVAVGLGLLQAVGLGSGDPLGVVVILAASLGTALRVTAIASRDWREPSEVFGWGSAVLLLEIAMAGAAGWKSFLPVVVAQFFLASLASRAAALLPDRGHRYGLGRRRWPLLTGASLLGVIGAMALPVAIGLRGGLLEGAGRLYIPLGALVLAMVALAVTGGRLPHRRQRGGGLVLAGIVLGFSTLIAVLVKFGHRVHRATQSGPGLATKFRGFGSGSGERLIGLVLAAVIVWLLLRALRRRWAGGGWIPGPDADEEPETVPAGEVPARERQQSRLPRRELPADTVRRWYAEVLLALERRGLPRPPDRTPSEYMGDVNRAFPECGSEFELLTSAYQDVRYGNRGLDESLMGHLASRRELVMRTIRHAERADQAEEGDSKGPSDSGAEASTEGGPG
jgi:hypothetical protein